jgi:uncharacterized protein RhaS with RHS repeats
LQYKRNRYYDPRSGQFTQEDPIGLAGGLNLYGYAGGDPVNYSDPFGLCIWDLCIGEGYATAVVAAGLVTILTAAYVDITNKHGSPSGWFRNEEAGAGSTGGPTAGRPATKAEKKAARERNRKANADGKLHCVYCGRETTETPGLPESSEIDHVEPRNPNDGGPQGNNEPENLKNACKQCNGQKSNKRPPFQPQPTQPQQPPPSP